MRGSNVLSNGFYLTCPSSRVCRPVHRTVDGRADDSNGWELGDIEFVSFSITHNPVVANVTVQHPVVMFSSPAAAERASQCPWPSSLSS